MMLLFENEKINNLLPCDGIATYHGRVLSTEQADEYFERLLPSIEWKNDEVIVFGERFVTKRKTAWYGDKNYLYRYSGSEKRALAWTAELRELKHLVERVTGAPFNSCLLNLYHNGDEGMGWHSDNEDSLEKGASIASLSLGAERRFVLKHKKKKETVSIILENGSLIEMKGETQSNWIHSLPKSKQVTEPRINLTFRKMGRGLHDKRSVD